MPPFLSLWVNNFSRLFNKARSGAFYPCVKSILRFCIAKRNFISLIVKHDCAIAAFDLDSLQRFPLPYIRFFQASELQIARYFRARFHQGNQFVLGGRTGSYFIYLAVNPIVIALKAPHGKSKKPIAARQMNHVALGTFIAFFINRMIKIPPKQQPKGGVTIFHLHQSAAALSGSVIKGAV